MSKNLEVSPKKTEKHNKHERGQEIKELERLQFRIPLVRSMSHSSQRLVSADTY
jgi:hypothetical protein